MKESHPNWAGFKPSETIKLRFNSANFGQKSPLMRYLFRTDSSSVIGSGHVTRCLTLAKELRILGGSCQFVCVDYPGSMVQQISQQGFEVILLPDEAVSSRSVLPMPCAQSSLDFPGVVLDWMTDQEQTKRRLGEGMVDWLIVDQYGIDYRWESAMRSRCKRLMVIDDLANRKHDCDILLDQNIVSNHTTRYCGLVSSSCMQLIGSEFCLLQSEYRDLHHRIPQRLGPVENILVYFGGADAENLTERCVDAFIQIGRSDICLDVVLSSCARSNVSIRSKTAGLKNVAIHDRVPSLATLMVKADLAIGAAGTTTWERCCMGLPAIVITIAENQLPIAKELNNRGAIRWIGHSDSVSVEDIRISVEVFLNDESSLAEFSKISSTLVDGQGTRRVASWISMNPNTQLVTRQAMLLDEDLILSWANDPVVRQSGFNPEPIDAVGHRKWFFKRLRNINGCYFFVVTTNFNVPIGQVRFEGSGDIFEIHYSLASGARGWGLGKRIIQLGITELRKSKPHFTILGRVKAQNVASQKIFEGLGFDSMKTDDGNLVYTKVY